VIVCHCKVVNHREIEDAVDAGARTIPEVGDICGAGTRCRGCWAAIADTMTGHLDGATESPCGLPRRTTVAA
jgi:bacterioferritin-associated ferredoxin